MKKILVYSPYWRSKGGGERYALTTAFCLKEHAEVSVAPITASDLRILGKQLELSVEGLAPVPAMTGIYERLGYDGIFWLSDGSIPFLPAKKRVIHFQAPFSHANGKSTKNKFKLLGTIVVCNSKFTKQFIDKEFGVDSLVVYPPVAVSKFTQMKKDKLILSVGRFVTTSQHKRPEILIQAFKKMIDRGLKQWRLCIVGIVESEESETIVTALRTMSRGYPVAIKTNLSHDRLISLYDHAAIYWHAAGYGSDVGRHPERAEHFGISTVEAMAAGAVPCVFSAGGQLEIVTHGQDGLLWKSPEELMVQTTGLIHEEDKRGELASAAIRRAKDFSEERFCKEIQRLFL